MRHAGLRVSWIALAGGLLAAAIATASSNNGNGNKVPDQLTVSVDCGQGQSLNGALGTAAFQLTVQFTGTCAEDVLISRGRVTLAGADSTATIVGTSDATHAALTIDGATGVALATFAVRNKDAWGVLIIHSAGAAEPSVLARGDIACP